VPAGSSAGDAQFPSICVGGAKSDLPRICREYVRVAPPTSSASLPYNLWIRRACEFRQSVPTQKDGQLARPTRRAMHRDHPRTAAPTPGLHHTGGTIVEHFAERVAEIFGYPRARTGPLAFYFRSEVAFDRDRAGRPSFRTRRRETARQSLVLLKPPSALIVDPNFETREIADDGNAAKSPFSCGMTTTRYREPLLVVDEQKPLEDALERSRSLPPPLLPRNKDYARRDCRPSFRPSPLTGALAIGRGTSSIAWPAIATINGIGVAGS